MIEPLIAPLQPPKNAPLSYADAGVQYELIDPLKVAAQRAAAATAGHLAAHGFSEVAESRGESAYVVDVGPFYLASIVECLGSKAMVADAMQALSGRSPYAGIAQDTIAMAVNDLITVGATPLVVQAYWAAGGSDWFADADRAQALVTGWKAACDACGVAWGGGETPALAGIVEAGRIDLAAACTGLVNPKQRLTQPGLCQPLQFRLREKVQLPGQLPGHEGKLLQRGDDDRHAGFQRLGELARVFVDLLHHALAVVELVDGVLQLAVQHHAVGDDHHAVERPFVAFVVQARQAMR